MESEHLSIGQENVGTEEQKEKRKPVTLEELKNLVYKDLYNDVREFDWESGKGMDKGDLEKEYKQHVDSTTAEFVRKLEERKDDFKFIFETSSGSKYFVLDSGECFRLKKFAEDNGGWNRHSPQPIMEMIYFVSKDQGKKASRLNEIGSSWTDNRKHWIDEEFGGDANVKFSREIALGLCTLEINMVDKRHNKLEISKNDDDTFRMTGGFCNNQRANDEDGFVFQAPMHFGHEITKIIKE